ncbi:MAG: OB-fold nucleic acid binding domain-containing protein [Anaerolineae bacterium]|nr:OB-fold nucleic acid binding domain-containing protein [Anaerolineae bacterium]
MNRAETGVEYAPPVCPSCGRYTGPYQTCPYCGARLGGRLSIRLAQKLALALSGIGLLVLWLAAVHAEPPLINIGQVGATMNLAYVRLKGRCVRSPSYDAATGYLSFWLDDGTGELRVSAYRAEARQLVAEGRVPALGDQVEVAGTLRVQEDVLALRVNAPEHLKITRSVPVERMIGSIGPADQFVRVQVRGRVRRIHEPYPGLTLVTVRDESGAIPIVITSDLIALSGISPSLSIGQSILAVGAVSLYRDTPQLVPASIAEIVPLEQPVPIARMREIAGLTSADIGRLVIVRGRVTEVKPFSAGVKLLLDDGSGMVTILLWQSLYDALPGGVLPGAEVEVQGEVAQRYGRLEVLPELIDDIRVHAAAPVPARENRAGTAIGDVTAADIGRVLTLTGTLGEPRTFSRGVKFSLGDDTGFITLLLWQEVYEALPHAARLVAGAQVEVTGRIDEYHGELEIVPEAGGVRLLE